MQGQGHNILISTGKPPLRSVQVDQMLVLEWVLLGYSLYLFGSIVNSGTPYHARTLIYCLVFLVFEKLQLTYKYLELEDPLHLSGLIKCMRWLGYVCMANISLLLVRIVIQQHNLHAFMMFMHYLVSVIFFLNELSRKNTKLDINIDHHRIFSKLITPLLLFLFNKTSEAPLSEFWLIELLLFATNLFLSNELLCVLLLKECQYFGWASFQENAKQKASWSRKRALRTIIVICCVVVVTQNLLLIFDKVKYEISITILHSFIVSATAYLLYIGRLPFTAKAA